MSSDGTYEFDCIECGQHVIAIGSPTFREFNLCSLCLALPGWFNSPALVAILRPERKEPKP